ncbi:protein angel homolog 1 isoform X2 [Cyprinodon tularosa]|uniref:protein angel homolog 1 isoform X2 n=1 Tax=Cyprinodon tularosa TaxID=77115 RepID=UPI0018E22CEA|nr:protein angel homolog 1 isoform X2 [Cyprinodon tularosa]
MIGSLLFYAFYPLVRFLFRPPSDPSKERVSVNGKAACNGDTASVRSPKPGTAMQDQSREIKEKLKEPDPKEEEPISTVLQEDERLSAEVLSTSEEGEGPKMNEEVVLHDMDGDQNKRDQSSSLVDHQNVQQEVVALLKCLNMDGSTQKTNCSEQNKSQTEIFDDSLGETPQVPNTERKNPSEPASAVTECWDDFTFSAGDLAVDREKNSNSQSRLKSGQQLVQQTGWHFPVGPGLTQEVFCPQWSFPAASYYTSMESNFPFEVMWRVWVDLDAASKGGQTPTIKKASVDFTVMSYNILSQDLLEENQQLYAHCPPEVLQWNYRCSLLLSEIEKWAPDILCLQEVQENHYHEHLYPVLSQMGYTCVYQRRTGTKTDGCAACYRSAVFTEAGVSKLEFFRPETGLLDRHNVGIVLLLRPLVTRGAEVKEGGPPLCVANTHLLFNPRRGDIKLAQLAIMLAEINAMIKSCKVRREHCNVVFCGDFNSIPYTPLYQLLTTGELYYQGIPKWMVSGQEDLSYKPSYHRLFAPLWPSSLGISDTCQYTEINTSKTNRQKSGTRQYSHEFMLQLRFCPAACVRPQKLILIPGVTDITPDTTQDVQHYEKRFKDYLMHQVDLESVYEHVLPGSGSPELTTLHSEGGATVDYIFYSPKRTSTKNQMACKKISEKGLKLLGYLSLLSEDLLWSMNGLPNHIFPSDHLSLVARFQMELDN